MTTPSFFDRARIGTLFYPDAGAIAVAAGSAGLAPASTDTRKIHLLIIDMQVDFCHEQGALYVPGAKDDIRRLIEFIYRHAARISGITCSLDSHLPHQIFHPAWWVDAHGEHPPAFTLITKADVARGRWRPVREVEWSLRYVVKLEEGSRKQLMVWPYHVPIGGIGSALDPELWSAVFWHSIARSSQPTMWTKGDIPQTEFYSIVHPEVPVPGHPRGGTGHDLLDRVRQSDHVLIAGEAASHCVLESVESLIEALGENSEEIRKIYLMRDCMSPVRHPQIDFEAITSERFARFETQGIRFIRSVDPLPFS